MWKADCTTFPWDESLSLWIYSAHHLFIKLYMYVKFYMCDV